MPYHSTIGCVLSIAMSQWGDGVARAGSRSRVARQQHLRPQLRLFWAPPGQSEARRVATNAGGHCAAALPSELGLHSLNSGCSQPTGLTHTGLAVWLASVKGSLARLAVQSHCRPRQATCTYSSTSRSTAKACTGTSVAAPDAAVRKHFVRYDTLCACTTPP